MNRKPRVVVADDEPAIAGPIAEMLAFAGFEVLTAPDAAEALAIARAKRPDVMLLDVMMQGLDGRDACRAVKMDQQLRDVPVVLLSSADEQDVHWRAAGADAFVQKPFSLRVLPEVLRALLGASP